MENEELFESIFFSESGGSRCLSMFAKIFLFFLNSSFLNIYTCMEFDSRLVVMVMMSCLLSLSLSLLREDAGVDGLTGWVVV